MIGSYHTLPCTTSYHEWTYQRSWDTSISQSYDISTRCEPKSFDIIRLEYEILRIIAAEIVIWSYGVSWEWPVGSRECCTGWLPCTNTWGIWDEEFPRSLGSVGDLERARDREFRGRWGGANTDISCGEGGIGSIDTRTEDEVSDIEGIRTRRCRRIDIISEDDIVCSCCECITCLIPEEDIIRRGEDIPCTISEYWIVEAYLICIERPTSYRGIIGSRKILILTRISDSSIITSISYLSQYSSTNRGILRSWCERIESIVSDCSIRIPCRDRVESEGSECRIKSHCPTSSSDSHISDEEISASKYNNLSTHIHRGEDSHFFCIIRLQYEILSIDRSEEVICTYSISREWPIRSWEGCCCIYPWGESTCIRDEEFPRSWSSPRDHDLTIYLEFSWARSWSHPNPDISSSIVEVSTPCPGCPIVVDGISECPCHIESCCRRCDTYRCSCRGESSDDIPIDRTSREHIIEIGSIRSPDDFSGRCTSWVGECWYERDEWERTHEGETKSDCPEAVTHRSEVRNYWMTESRPGGGSAETALLKSITIDDFSNLTSVNGTDFCVGSV